MLVGIAALFAWDAIRTLSYKGTIVATCSRETSSKSRWLCEIGDWMLRALPTTWQAPALGIFTACFALALLFMAGLLIKGVRNNRRLDV